MKIKQELREDAKRKEFWAIIKTSSPRLYRALALTDKMEVRLVAVCASALVQIAMKEVLKKQKRKPSAWSLFAGEQMKNGKSIREAAELWKANK